MRTLYLIGFMGSGKSTVGKLLHEVLGITHLDTDQMVVEKYGEIATIFQQEGEKQFRAYETGMMKQTPDENTVVSTGGGVVEKQENRVFMKQHGFIVHLDSSYETIADRLGSDPERPLWRKNDSDKQQLYQRRKKLYSELADLKVVTDHKSPQSVVEEILGHLY
ncbi:shikimate kinase [Lentibacillus salicampi]|uniref:Shikimate kinase n=1 Tax=Lentibacillus salicampi TaxID=175306 RepID=A0A4Y9AE45_9BACI|nr:shikimate kinase [Lentibacillus salicampi]TFJ93685.1 shikimate kinase [Lentibacillus salicampi]